MLPSLRMFAVLFICAPVLCQPLLRDAVDMDIELLAEESRESNINEAAFARVSRSAEDYDYDDEFHDHHLHDHHFSHGHHGDRGRGGGFFGPPGLGHRFDHPLHRHSHECRHPHDFDHPHHHSTGRRGGPPSRSYPGSRPQQGEEGDEEDGDDADEQAAIPGQRTHQQIPSVTETHPRSEPAQATPTSTAMRSGAGVVGVVTSPSSNLPPPRTTSAAPPTSSSSFSRSADPLQSTTPSTVVSSSTPATDEPTFNIDLRFGGD